MNSPDYVFDAFIDTSLWHDYEPEEELHMQAAVPLDALPHDDGEVEVSTMFPPPSDSDPCLIPPDLRLLSADGSLFFVHQTALFVASDNFFNFLLPVLSPVSPDADLPLLFLPETSTVLSVMLHALYGRPFHSYSLSVEEITEAIDSLARYGVPPKFCMERDQPLWSLLRFYAPVRPVDVYATAAHYAVKDVAVIASAYTLDASVSDLTEAQVLRMGPLYLKHFAALHERRMGILRNLMLSPPDGHEMTSRCNYSDQHALKRVWGNAVADLAWVATPGLSTKVMRVALEARSCELKCSDCLANYSSHSKSRLRAWSEVDRTIELT